MATKNIEQKIMTFTKIKSGNKYVPGLKIAGIYLKEFGFDFEDKAKITITKNKVTIEKLDSQGVFDYLCTKNPRLKALSNNLDLVLLASE